MRTVGLKILKNKLSEYVRLAAGGETILVTDRNRVVAELVPPHATGNAADDWLADQIRKGLITPARNPGAMPPRPRHPVMSLADVLKLVDEGKDDE